MNVGTREEWTAVIVAREIHKKCKDWGERLRSDRVDEVDVDGEDIGVIDHRTTDVGEVSEVPKQPDDQVGGVLLGFEDCRIHG